MANHAYQTTPTAETPDWRTQAKCAEIGGDLWFADDTFGNHAQLRRAKQICAECPVAAQCLEAGMGERFGVWGGFTTEERNRMRKARAKKRSGDAA